MDMALTNLFKHKIRFELESEESDYLEHRFIAKDNNIVLEKKKT